MTLLSSTDLKCVWSNQQKKQEMEKFEPVPIDMFCHVNLEEENYSKTYSEENLNELYENLLAATPNSAISKHRKGRMKINEIELDQLGNDKNNNLDTLIASAFDTSSELWNKASHIIRNGQNGNSALVNASVEVTSSEDELKFYHSDICLNEENCIKLCIGTIDQGNNKSWLQARSSRITGSTCYGFYTYGNRKGQNWDVKIDSFITNRDNFKGNINTRYGQNTEPEARLKYENKTGYQVFECGLVVLPNVPWLGFSPDGIVFKEGSPHHLIEIKCPVLGKDSSIQHLIKTNKISYISEV